MTGPRLSWDQLVPADRINIARAAGLEAPEPITLYAWRELSMDLRERLYRVDWFKALGIQELWEKL